MKTRPVSRPVTASVFVITTVLLCGFAFAAETPSALTANWSARQRLAEKGIEPFAISTDELWANINGGVETGVRWNSFLDFGLKLDTEKLCWWHGGKFTAEAHWVENQDDETCFADLAGGVNPVSNAMANNHLRIYNLFYQHSWRDDAFTIKLGQIAGDDDFMHSDYSSLFLNSAFGAMPSQVGTWLGDHCGHTPAFAIWPVASPGFFLHLKPSEKIDLQSGVYHGQPGPDIESNHGFAWPTGAHSGVGVFYEGAYAYSLGKTHPGTFRLGGTFHTGIFDNYPQLNAGISAAAAEGVHSFYALNDLVLLQNETNQPTLAVFWRGGISPQSDRSIVTMYSDFGLNWFGPIPGRQNDTAGIAFSYMGYGSEFRRSTSSQVLASSESTLEVTYRAPINRWLTIQADLQFLFNPALNPNSNSRETATILGLRAQMNF